VSFRPTDRTHTNNDALSAVIVLGSAAGWTSSAADAARPFGAHGTMRLSIGLLLCAAVLGS